MDDDRAPAEPKQFLLRQGARPSRSADAAREQALAEIRALSVEERILLALRLGRRDRALRESSTRKREP